jgi:gamma-glutamyltranspeptidase/glutathione hydrolase
MRDRHITDIAAMRVSVEEILSKAWAAKLRSRISPDEAMTDVGPLGLRMSDTVYMSVVDKDLNAVSFINSIFDSFGSGILCPETGVLFQNRGHSFSLDAAHPNALAPGKRPMHTIMPGMVTDKGRPVMSFGVMGGDYQPLGQGRVISAVFDHGLDLQEALDMPRVFPGDGDVEVERSLPPGIMHGLTAKGHALRLADDPLGGGQAIQIDHERGVLIGASDPRKDGHAAGY